MRFDPVLCGCWGQSCYGVFKIYILLASPVKILGFYLFTKHLLWASHYILGWVTGKGKWQLRT